MSEKVLVVVEMDDYDTDGSYHPIVTDWFLATTSECELLADPAGGHLNFHYAHDKGRNCARTDEVLVNYMRRALKAEAELNRRESEDAS